MSAALRWEPPVTEHKRRIKLERPMRHVARMGHWLTTLEVADRLGVSRQRAHVIAEDRRWRTEKVRVGNRWRLRIALCCVEAHLLQHGCPCGRST